MKQFDYTIKDALGIHARPAGQIAKIAREYDETAILVEHDGRVAKASSLMKLMSLCAKQGGVITVKAEGPSEDAAIIALGDYIWNNL